MIALDVRGHLAPLIIEPHGRWRVRKALVDEVAEQGQHGGAPPTSGATNSLADSNGALAIPIAQCFLAVGTHLSHRGTAGSVGVAEFAVRDNDWIASDTAALILDAVDRNGVMLVHDAVLPSVTGLVVGAPVTGSWWSHPMANQIYNALGEIEDQLATVKLVRKKDTLVARRLWGDLAGLGMSRSAWQLKGLDPQAEALLAEIDASDAPVAVDKARRELAKSLATRLLVCATEVHTDAGHHIKIYWSWKLWASTQHVMPATDAAAAANVFRAIVAQWPSVGRSKLLPW